MLLSTGGGSAVAVCLRMLTSLNLRVNVGGATLCTGCLLSYVHELLLLLAVLFGVLYATAAATAVTLHTRSTLAADRQHYIKYLLPAAIAVVSRISSSSLCNSCSVCSWLYCAATVK
jgi:hypothetical protein